MPWSVLVIESDPDIATAIQDLLTPLGCLVDVASRVERFRSVVPYRTVIIDMTLAFGDASRFIHQVITQHPEVQTIVLTSHHTDKDLLTTVSRQHAIIMGKPYDNMQMRRCVQGSVPVIGSN
jgi:DNA-binding NtrC family response regulator